MFRKVKFDGTQVTLVWADQPNAKRSLEHTLTSSEPPRPEFIQALAGLRPWVLACLGVSAEALDLAARPDRLEIRGVTRTDSDYGGAVVTALLRTDVADAPLVLNTPHVSWEPTSEGGRALPAHVRAALDLVDDEASRYQRGERAQQDLFGGPPAPPPADLANAVADALADAAERGDLPVPGVVERVTLSLVRDGTVQREVVLNGYVGPRD